jgi:hypothetical protein
MVNCIAIQQKVLTKADATHIKKPIQFVTQVKKKEMTHQQQINSLLEKNQSLSQEKEKLEKEQESFLEELFVKIEEIEKVPKFWRWFKYVELVVDMITTIKTFIEKKKALKNS